MSRRLVGLETELRGARAAYAALAQAQKSGAGVPSYMRVVNRRLGRIIASIASQGRTTPDQLTLAGLITFLAGAGLLMGCEPDVPMAIGATALFQIAFAFDSADGQLARLRGGGSPAGEWLDHVVDFARHLTFHLSVLICLIRFTDVSEAVLLVPLLFGLASTTRFFAQVLAEQLAGRGAVTGSPAVPRWGPLIQAPADTGLLNLVVLLWPRTTLFLWTYAFLAGLNTLLLVASLQRRHRELSRPQREAG